MGGRRLLDLDGRDRPLAAASFQDPGKTAADIPVMTWANTARVAYVGWRAAWKSSFRLEIAI